MNIWVVDDDRIQHMINKRAVSKLWPEATVKAFLNPVIAIEALKTEGQPQILFLDLSMPEMSGFEFLEHMKIEQFNFDVCVVSSSIDPQDIQRAKSYHTVKAYVSKPLTVDKIMSNLKL